MDMRKHIQELAAANRNATTERGREAVEAEMQELRALDPKAFTEALESLIKDTAMRVEELTMAEKIGEVAEMVSMAYIARTYFGKSRSWLAHKLHGDLVNGKPSHFTESELKTLKEALGDMSKKLGSLSVSL